jgi:hypothetical protein
VNDLSVKNTPILCLQGKFMAKIHQQADGLQNREVLSMDNLEGIMNLVWQLGVISSENINLAI